MKVTVKKVVSILLVAVMLLCAAPLSGFVGLELFGFRASAVEETDTTIFGTIGTKLSWSIDKASKVLTIDNEGEMISFASDDAPWKSYKEYFDSVVINEGCTNISRYAFSHCDNITLVELADTIDRIDDSAFYSCYGLNVIELPNKLTVIRDWAFAYCSSLQSVTIPDSVSVIGGGAFVSCNNLSTVNIGCNVERICFSAFNGCNSIELINIPYCCNYIDDSAFANCSKLSEIYIYNKNCYIDETAISIYSTIYGYTGSTAETFANTYGYNFISIDTPCEHTYSNDCDISCNICGETRETAHDYSEWSVTKEATCNKTGLRERTCSICGDVDKEIIEMLPHTDEDEDGICEVCKKQFEIKYPMHGVCGDNLTWKLDDEGVLTIEGTGSMYDFNSDNCVYIYNGPVSDETTTRYHYDATTTTRIYDDPDDGFNTTTTVWYPEHTTGYDTPTTDNVRPSVTHPNGDGYYEGTTLWRETTTRKSSTTKPAETTTERYEESTTVPSTTRPKSTTAPAKLHRAAVVDDGFYRTTVPYDPDATDGFNEISTTRDYNVEENYIKIFRWNLYFDQIKKVVISEGVTSIGDYAFANCPQLTDIDMPDSITRIGDRAFVNCSGLEDVEIPVNVTTIEYNAFRNCTLLETLNFNAKNCNSIYGETFYNCNIKTLNVGVGVNTLPDINTYETVVFADGATKVPNNVFNYCEKLTTVILPDTITTIGYSAFYNCTSLESIDIPDSVTYIDEYAFRNCSNLTTVTTPANECYIGYYAFYNCANLTTINYNIYSGTVYYNAFNNCPVTILNIGPGVNSIPNFSTVEIVTFADGATVVPNSAFSSCYNLKTVNLPDTITRIEYNAFYNCDSLANIELPESITYIANCAFEGCDSLLEITIPENVEKMGWDAFGYCTNLSTVNFNAKNCLLGSDVFYKCPVKSMNVGTRVNILPNLRTLETVTFENGAKKVPNNSFSNCTELTSVNLPDSIETIGYRAFDYCTKLESITLPKNLKTVGEKAFYACYNLKTADLPDPVERIERMAFDNCTSLEEIILPDAVEYIGQYAFYGCTSVPSITIPENVSQIGYAAFGSCYALESVEFNATECDINSRDIFYGCNNISSVKIGSKVTKIPALFMKDKERLTSVSIPSSVKEIGAAAFNGTSLSIVNITNGIEIIGENSFANIESAKEVSIPETVITIDPHAFANLTNLEKINFNAVNANVNRTYYWCYGDMFANSGTDGDGITVVFGDKVETVPAYLFEVGSETAYPNIKNVIIGSNVKIIGDYAFYHCCALENVEFGESVETIGEHAFDGCFSLKSLKLPESLKTVSYGAFYSCNGLNEIAIPKNVESIGINSFGRCESVEEINYNASNCNVDYNNSQYAFNNCKGVKTVNIGDNVKTLSTYTFTGCSSLEKVYIPDIVISIDPLTFDGCGNVAIVCKNGSYANVYAVQNGIKYVLEDSVTGTAFEIRNSMLLGYSGSAQNVVLPSDINSVGIDAFKGSSVVKSIEVPYNVSKIYSGAFANCPNLERVIIPFTVTDISGSAFAGTDATIYCYYNSYAYNYAVANNIKYELITVTLSTNSINIVETEAVTVNAVPSVTLASGVPLVWKSNNPAVASVDSTGKIVGNSVGNTTVGIYALDGNLLDECSVTVGEKSEIKLEDVSTDTLKYGEKIVLHISTANLPEGASVKWTTTNGNILKISNENVACGNHTDCLTCTVESVGNGDAEIKATVVDKDGDPIIQNGEEVSTSYKMNSKAGFFQKIIAFFKKLFGLLKTYPQAF